MDDNVVEFGGVTSLPTNPYCIVKRALDADLTSIVVVGFKPDGSEFFASSEASGAEALWLLERARHKLLSVPDRHE